MNDIEQKALALVKEVAEHDCYEIDDARFSDVCAALYRAIEQHEAFRQEVSDAVEQVPTKDWDVHPILWRFIIPKPKPDPLVEVIDAWFNDFRQEVSDAASFRTALDAFGLEIREKSDD